MFRILRHFHSIMNMISQTNIDNNEKRYILQKSISDLLPSMI